METNDGKYTEAQHIENSAGWMLYDAPYKCAKHIARNIIGETALDVGGSQGIMARIVEAVTLNRVKIAVTEESLKDVPDNHYDTVYTSHVLEHVHKLYDIIKETNRIANYCSIHVVPQGDVEALNTGTPHVHTFNRISLIECIKAALGREVRVKLSFIPDEHMNSLMIIIWKDRR